MKTENEFFLKQMLRNMEDVDRLMRDYQSGLIDGLLQFCKERHCSINNIRYDAFLQWLKNQKR